MREMARRVGQSRSGLSGKRDGLPTSCGIAFAPSRCVRLLALIACGALTLSVGGGLQTEPRPGYRLESRSNGTYHLRERLAEEQLQLLEKLNRADVDTLEGLPELVLPESWDIDELNRSPLPLSYAAAASMRKMLIVYLPGQVFGAYENGTLVHWGPISSGSAISPTPTGSFNLNWRSTGRASTVEPDWFMRWYFNFGNQEGLAFHQYVLPGHPASHGCVRLLQRDAMWLYEWGEGWTLTPNGRIAVPGTPVSILGPYDFNAPPPWRSLAWLTRGIELPELPSTRSKSADYP